MNRKCKACLLIFSILISSILIVIIKTSPIFILKREASKINHSELANKFNLSELIISESNNLKLYIKIHASDTGGSEKVNLYPGIYKLKDKINVAEFCKGIRCTVTGSDVATLESRLIICDDSNILLDAGADFNSRYQGFQSRELGWVQTTGLSDEKIETSCDRLAIPILVIW